MKIFAVVKFELENKIVDSTANLTFIQAEESSMTGTWFRALQYYSQCLGGWRRRRRGLPNIMVDPGVV